MVVVVQGQGSEVVVVAAGVVVPLSLLRWLSAPVVGVCRVKRPEAPKHLMVRELWAK